MKRILSVFLCLAWVAMAAVWGTQNGKTVGSATGNYSKQDGITIGTATGNYNSWNGLTSPGGGGGGSLTVNSQMPSGVGVTTSSANPWTWSFTNTAGTVLYLFVSVDDGTASVSATYAGASMTSLASHLITSGSGTLTMFRKTSPATGANNFVISWTGGNFPAIAGAISFTGNNATPDSGSPSVSDWGGSTISSTYSTSVTGTTSGNIVLAGVCYGDTGYASQSGTRTFLLEVNSGSFCNSLAAQYQTSPGGTVTPSFTGTATSWTVEAIEVKH